MALKGLTISQLSSWVEQGIPRVKLKTSRHPEQDAERLSAIRRQVGSKVSLMADANGAPPKLVSHPTAPLHCLIRCGSFPVFAPASQVIIVTAKELVQRHAP